MRSVLLFCLASVLLPHFSRADSADPKPKVEISFDEFKGMQDKRGRILDGSIKFYFADEQGPKADSEELSARGSTFTSGDPERACRLSLLTAFISFQERAKREGAKAVVDLRTYAEFSVYSKSRRRCLCRSGNRTFTTVKGRLAQMQPRVGD